MESLGQLDTVRERSKSSCIEYVVFSGMQALRL